MAPPAAAEERLPTGPGRKGGAAPGRGQVTQLSPKSSALTSLPGREGRVCHEASRSRAQSSTSIIAVRQDASGAHTPRGGFRETGGGGPGNSG